MADSCSGWFMKAGGVNGEISGCPVSLSERVNGDRLGQVVWSSSEYTGLRKSGAVDLFKP